MKKPQVLGGKTLDYFLAVLRHLGEQMQNMKKFCLVFNYNFLSNKKFKISYLGHKNAFSQKAVAFLFWLQTFIWLLL